MWRGPPSEAWLAREAWLAAEARDAAPSRRRRKQRGGAVTRGAVPAEKRRGGAAVRVCRIYTVCRAIMRKLFAIARRAMPSDALSARPSTGRRERGPGQE